MVPIFHKRQAFPFRLVPIFLQGLVRNSSALRNPTPPSLARVQSLTQSPHEGWLMPGHLSGRDLHLFSKGLEPTELWGKRARFGRDLGWVYQLPTSSLPTPLQGSRQEQETRAVLQQRLSFCQEAPSILTLGPNQPGVPCPTAWGWEVGCRNGSKCVRQWFPATSPKECPLITLPKHLKSMGH